jgi:hypothetical protein
MANLHTATRSVAGRVDVVRGSRAATEIGLYQCLVVSADAERRQTLAEAALAAGWEPVPCCDPAAGLAACGLVHLQMAMVDLERSALVECQPLLERLALKNDLLLVVCGREGDLQEEIFVRQVGAWLYLPGVIEGGQMTVLCTEARVICARDRDTSKKSSRLPGSGSGHARSRRR